MANNHSDIVLDFRSFLQQVARRRGFDDKGEGTVGKARNDDRARHAFFKVLRLVVEGFAEFHDVQTALAESRTNRR